MKLLSRLNRPWIHFLILGFALFTLQGWLFPPPLPVVGPLSQERIEALEQQWFATVRRLPTEQQRQNMIASELDRDMLFHRALELELHRFDSVVYQRLLRNMRFLQLGEDKSDAELYQQALEMRLHLGDEVVKRRMIQVMEQILLGQNPPKPVAESQIEAAFLQRREELRQPRRYDIEHLYFNQQRFEEFGSVRERVRSQGLSPGEARQFSSPFLPGYLFKSQSPDQLVRHFGADFVRNLEALDPVAGDWYGPVDSTYGRHLVWVDQLVESRDATIEEVRLTLTRDLELKARQTALAAAIDALSEDFEVRQ